MKPTKSQVFQTMRTYGGNFASHLAIAWQCADPDNKELIEKTWPAYYARYSDMAEYEIAAHEATATA